MATYRQEQLLAILKVRGPIKGGHLAYHPVVRAKFDSYSDLRRELHELREAGRIRKTPADAPLPNEMCLAYDVPIEERLELGVSMGRGKQVVEVDTETGDRVNIKHRP